LRDFEAPTFSLDNRLTDGGEVVSLTGRPPFTPQEDSCYSIFLEAESIPGLEVLGQLKEVIIQSTFHSHSVEKFLKCFV
jgi:hypothetical protein